METPADQGAPALQPPAAAEPGESVKALIHYVHPDETLDSVLAVFGRTQVKEIAVVSRKLPRRLLGFITLDDVACAVARAHESETG